MPMITPPARDARVPEVDVAPLVPGGTLAKVVIRRGGDLDKIPISDAMVSPKQHAKCLKAELSIVICNACVDAPQGHEDQCPTPPSSNVWIQRAGHILTETRAVPG
jgi:hypothetical protein